MEEALVSPYRLKDLPFSGLKQNTISLRMGPIIDNSLAIWKHVERYLDIPGRLHKNSPLWRNYNLLSDSKPFIFPPWSNNNVYVLDDLFDENCLQTFQTLKETFSLPATSYFFYHRIRSALRASGVPLTSPLCEHTLYKFLTLSTTTRGLVSFLYNKFIKAKLKPLGVVTMWHREFERLNVNLNWENIWENVFISSKNLAHQVINYKLPHRFYITPHRAHQMKLMTDNSCKICHIGIPGYFLHMFWECPVILDFCKRVAQTLSDLLAVKLPLSPALLLLGDNSNIVLNLQKRRLFMAGLTAAKKSILNGWFEPQCDRGSVWLSFYLSILILERSTAKLHGASTTTLNNWTKGIDFIKALI